MNSGSLRAVQYYVDEFTSVLINYNHFIGMTRVISSTIIYSHEHLWGAFLWQFPAVQHHSVLFSHTFSDQFLVQWTILTFSASPARNSSPWSVNVPFHSSPRITKSIRISPFPSPGPSGKKSAFTPSFLGQSRSAGAFSPYTASSVMLRRTEERSFPVSLKVKHCNTLFSLYELFKYILE